MGRAVGEILAFGIGSLITMPLIGALITREGSRRLSILTGFALAPLLLVLTLMPRLAGRREQFRRAEDDRAAGRDEHLLSSLGIASATLPLLADQEGAEAGDLDLFAFS